MIVTVYYTEYKTARVEVDDSYKPLVLSDNEIRALSPEEQNDWCKMTDSLDTILQKKLGVKDDAINAVWSEDGKTLIYEN